MSKLAATLKDEIQRLARKEIKTQTISARQASAQYRRDIAALKRQVTDLSRRVVFLERQAKRQSSKPAPESLAENARFSPKWVRAHREKLDLSAADYAQLVGVSALTIYNWEGGKSRPRAPQLASLVAVRKLGKREAWKRLEIMEA